MISQPGESKRNRHTNMSPCEVWCVYVFFKFVIQYLKCLSLYQSLTLANKNELLLYECSLSSVEFVFYLSYKVWIISRKKTNTHQRTKLTQPQNTSNLRFSDLFIKCELLLKINLSRDPLNASWERRKVATRKWAGMYPAVVAAGLRQCDTGPLEDKEVGWMTQSDVLRVLGPHRNHVTVCSVVWGCRD